MTRPGRLSALRPAAGIAPVDPLAEVRPWGVAGVGVIEGKGMRPGIGRGSGMEPSLPLTDMVDRASAQLVILRRTLDEASGVSRRAGQAALEIGQRVDEAAHAQAELDQRLDEASAASLVLEKATVALRGLEQLVGQIRGAAGALEERVNAKFAAQEEAFEQRLADLGERFDARIAGVWARAEEIEVEAERKVRHDTDRIGAAIDRRTAQVQARVSLVLDSASDRVSTLESQAENIGGVMTQRVESLCREAARVLGHDPRQSDSASLGEREPREGSLAERVAVARGLVREAEEASIRLAALVVQAGAAGSRGRGATGPDGGGFDRD